MLSLLGQSAAIVPQGWHGTCFSGFHTWIFWADISAIASLELVVTGLRWEAGRGVAYRLLQNPRELEYENCFYKDFCVWHLDNHWLNRLSTILLNLRTPWVGQLINWTFSGYPLWISEGKSERQQNLFSCGCLIRWKQKPSITVNAEYHSKYIAKDVF